MEGAIDLSGMTIPELHQLQRDAEKRMEEIREEQAREARAQLDALADELAEKTGLSKSQLLANIRKGARKGGKVAAKYRKPDGSETWAGRGRKPAWVNDHLANGGKLADLAIK